MNLGGATRRALRRLADWLHRAANPALCTIAFTPHGVHAVRGTPPPGFVADCADIGRDLGLTTGHVDVVVASGRVQLRFSPNLPATCHQRLRNVFGVHAQRRGPRPRR